MASETQFDEGGFKMLASVAMLAAGGAPGIIGAIGFVQGVVNFMTSSDTTDALNTLKAQIEQMNSVLVTIEDRLDELERKVAIETNRQTRARLNDYLNAIQNQGIRLHDQPDDLDTANELGVVIDKFLRSDFEIWRSTAPAASSSTFATG